MTWASERFLLAPGAVCVEYRLADATEATFLSLIGKGKEAYL